LSKERFAAQDKGMRDLTLRQAQGEDFFQRYRAAGCWLKAGMTK
jgi:hypothetical protein